MLRNRYVNTRLARRLRLRHIAAMLHIAKLAVGVRDLDHLRDLQAARRQEEALLRHRTRNTPRCAAEVLDGGSLYWVIAGTMLARQRIVDIAEARWDDGSRCCALVLDPSLVQVSGRRTKAFQGWRYLSAGDAPADLAQLAAAPGASELPPDLLRALQALCLL